MIDLSLNRSHLRNHWQSYKPQYVIAVIGALLGAWLLFSMTTPQIPYDKRVDVVIYSSSSSSLDLEKWEAELQAVVPADQTVNIQLSPLLNDVQMAQLVVARISAGSEGTVWILPTEYYQMVATMGAFLPLDDKLSDFDLPEGIDLNTGYSAITDSEGNAQEVMLYGIPLDGFKGLTGLFDPKGMVLALPMYAESNYDNAVTAANWFFSKRELNDAVGATASPAQATASPAETVK